VISGDPADGNNLMRILVLGASGRVGERVVARALAKKHQVVALVREPSLFKVRAPGLRVLTGSPLSRGHVLSALQGCDAVVVALGHTATDGKPTREYPVSEAVRNVVAAMQVHRIRRVIVLSAEGVGSSLARMPLLFRLRRKMQPLRAAFDDHDAAEAVLRSADLDWTLVRPVRYGEGPQSRRIILSFEGRPRPARHITRDEVAQVIVGLLSDQTLSREALTISATDAQ
jgi:uncharacterized protein YbjT (DUF2867 family)